MGWIIGYAVGLVVVLLVVALLLLMIRGASKVADQAGAVVEALESARDRSAGLWDVGTTTTTARRITRAATAARHHLESGA
ncbi:hypothetical protein BH23ACT9_BH23ACT9_31780 [soil metagenome]